MRKKAVLGILSSSCLTASLFAAFLSPSVLATGECVGNTNGETYGDCVSMKVYTTTDGRIIVKYWGTTDWDFYHLRWGRPGMDEKGIDVRGSGAGGSWWALNKAWDDTPYTFKVQACRSHFLASSDCTDWQIVRDYYKGGGTVQGEPEH